MDQLPLNLLFWSEKVGPGGLGPWTDFLDRLFRSEKVGPRGLGPPWRPRGRAEPGALSGRSSRAGAAESGREVFAHVLDNINNSVFGTTCSFRIIEIPIEILTFSRSQRVWVGRAGTGDPDVTSGGQKVLQFLSKIEN